jgi:hypothetical protein
LEFSIPTIKAYDYWERRPALCSINGLMLMVANGACVLWTVFDFLSRIYSSYCVDPKDGDWNFPGLKLVYVHLWIEIGFAALFLTLFAIVGIF